MGFIKKLLCKIQQDKHEKIIENKQPTIEEQSVMYAKNCDWGLYRNSILNMYDKSMKENRKSDAFLELAEVIYYDLSGLSNGSCKYDQEILIKMEIERCYEMNFPYHSSMATIAPGVVNYLYDMKEDFSWSTDELRNGLISAFEKFNAVRHLFTKEECVDIAIAELERDTDKLIAIYSNAETRFKEQYKKYLIDNKTS